MTNQEKHHSGAFSAKHPLQVRSEGDMIMADTWKDSDRHPLSNRDSRPAGKKNRRSRGQDRARRWGGEPASQDFVFGDLDGSQGIQKGVQRGRFDSSDRGD